MSKSNAERVFRTKAPGIMHKLRRDLVLTVDEAAAIVGNAGHECLGFTVMQEIKPVVAGSRGGYGWFQWTGPRRRAFEAFAAQHKLSIDSDEANYQFLLHELATTEKRAIPALKKAVGLRNKVIAFEDTFERAGVKAYDSRTRWAEIAVDAYNDANMNVETPAPAPVPTPAPAPSPAPAPAPVPTPVPTAQGATVAKWVIGAVGAIIAAFATWMMKG